jgi:PAS domain S-box-containing protein
MRRIPLLITFVLIFSLFIIQPVHSAPSSGTGIAFYPGVTIRFEKISIDDGLSQNAGLAMLQDSQGYLWIGTQDGLNRYDGYSITQFKHDKENPNTLSHNSIISIYEDQEGYLWFGTWGGGLNRYDQTSGQFDRFLPDPQDESSLASGIVTDIVQDTQGRLWIGTMNGLDLFDTGSGKFIHFRNDPDNPNTLSSNAVSSILPTEDGNLWVGTGAYSIEGTGLNLFDPQNGTAERIAPRDNNCLSLANVSSLIEAKDGSLWISYGGYSVSGNGFDHFFPESGICQHFDIALSNGQIIDNNVAQILLDNEERLWIASWSGGLFHMEPNTIGQLQQIKHDTADPDSLSSNSVYSLLQDHSGVLWVGTLNAGINKLNPDALIFRTYQHNPAMPGSISSNHISSFAETSDGRMWVGTWETGLSLFNVFEGTFEAYRFDPRDPTSLSSDLVMSLFADPDGSLWVGTLGGGLNHFSPKTKQFQRFQHNPHDPTSLVDDQVTSMDMDGTGRLWITTMGGISRLDPGKKHFVNYPNLPVTAEKPPVSILIDGDLLWLGTWGGGAARLDISDPKNLLPDQAVFTHFQTNENNPNAINDNSIWCFHKSADGLYWLGTQGGLNRFDPRTGIFKAYTEKNGLRNTTILGILEDDYGYLWITTNNGLAKFDPQKETFQIFDKNDGLQSNEFNSNAYYKSPTNRNFYIGGTAGFNIFNPLSTMKNSPSPAIVITDFKIFNESHIYEIQQNTPLQLNYDQNFISFEFAALDFRAPEKNVYAYKLENFDPDWVYSGTRRYASYTNLPGGDYVFLVKAAGSNGNWSEEDLQVPLKIIPPFWQTWQFMLSAVVLLAGIVAAGFQWRVKAVNQNAEKLADLITQKTADLSSSNEQLEKEVELRKTAEAELARRAAEELQHSHARFQAVFDNTAVGVAIMTLDRHIVEINPTASLITGYSSSEISKINVSNLAVEADRTIDHDLFAELMEGKRKQYTIEKRYIHKSGHVFWGRVNFAAVWDANNKPLYVVGMIEDITEEKQAAEKLIAQEAEYRRALEQRIAERTEELNKANELLQKKAAQEAVTSERTRLARELHDAVTQTLFSATMIADVLPDIWHLNKEEGLRRLEELRQLTRGALAEMRTLLVELRPNALVEVPLPILLRQLTEAMIGRTRVNILLNIEGERKLPPEVQVGLYRVTQEALNNIGKHAKATQAIVNLRLGDTVRLTIEDDGKGFDPTEVTADHLGLKIMRERAEAIGAKFSVYSEPGDGTQISFIWQ